MISILFPGIGLCNVELGTTTLTLHFSSQATPLKTLGSAMVIHVDNVVHIQAHVSPLHTSVIFFYLTPPFAAVLCGYLHGHPEFASYRKEDNFNAYGVIAVVLQPVTESRGWWRWFLYSFHYETHNVQVSLLNYA